MTGAIVCESILEAKTKKFVIATWGTSYWRLCDRLLVNAKTKADVDARHHHVKAYTVIEGCTWQGHEMGFRVATKEAGWVHFRAGSKAEWAKWIHALLSLQTIKVRATPTISSNSTSTACDDDEVPTFACEKFQP
ncbi:hypothetical protein SDRG_14999 [Saprolegnia diclina VS20]|uniref:PH domain-containing protein n=1 Tax=Saprolegnia diclina (strain VS20) TaxID=1156394 RepID=T0RC68_SAPDV|nr:hypothetical protein SDRG_14999 [Saprolegnia diclina VS20]EQC27197.1 hypothetical protein SDRG_14999 [Saprolegnia diclina VS20]|eukprot:XP_008619384.1 hypothetical protein SDRG_14999 [Saprolegnia diclina VS20]